MTPFKILSFSQTEKRWHLIGFTHKKPANISDFLTILGCDVSPDIRESLELNDNTLRWRDSKKQIFKITQ